MTYRFILGLLSRWLWIFLAWLPSPCLGADREDDYAESMSALGHLDERVATLAHRLAVASADFCAEREYLAGLTVHHLSQYDPSSRQGLQRELALGVEPQVLALAATGPAEMAGLRVGDAILSIDGQDLNFFPIDHPMSVEPINTLQSLIDAAFEDGFARLIVETEGTERAVEIEAELGCRSKFYVLPSSKLNARADGMNVVVTSSLILFVQNDDELAAALAHELAHNVLRHRSRIAQASRLLENDRRAFSRFLRSTESDADLLSLELLQRAGYDPAAAISLWKRLGPKKESLFGSTSHPGWRERVYQMEQALEQFSSNGR